MTLEILLLLWNWKESYCEWIGYIHTYEVCDHDFSIIPSVFFEIEIPEHMDQSWYEVLFMLVTKM